MSKFKVGEAKTVVNIEAFISEITDIALFGRIMSDGVWLPAKWTLEGVRLYPLGTTSFNLLPNAEPLRAEFEEVVKFADFYYGSGKTHTKAVVIVPDEFAGMCVKVTLEVLE